MSRPVLTRSLMAAATLAVALAAPAAAPLAQQSATTVLPGYWQFNARAAVFLSDSGSKCLRPGEVDRFFTSFSPKNWVCTYNRREVANGRVRLEGTCVDHKGRRGEVRLSGTYGPERLTLSGSVRPPRLVRVPASVTATRIAAQCPAGADNF